jgi:hypothetical protein
MSGLLRIEAYKLFKKKWFCLGVFLTAIVGSYFSALSTKNSFVQIFSYWAQISHDPDPYNFMLNKTAWTAGPITLLCLILLGFAITSAEYRKNTIIKIEMSVVGFRKVILAKTVLLFLLGLVCFVFSLLTFHFVFRSVPIQHSDIFKGFMPTTQLTFVVFFVIIALSILKISLFHQVVMVLSKKHYYVPLALGLLCEFGFLVNYLPYGIFYRTTYNGDWFNFVVGNNLIITFVVLVIYVVVLNSKVQAKLKFLFASL